jgi:hypothetical protein
MRLGDIFYWNTDKASGYDNRYKYHLYITVGDWRFDGNVFLMINKSDYGDDYKILKVDYDFFPLDYSFIGCGSTIVYSDAELSDANPEHKGRLSDTHIKQLYEYVQNSETMSGHEIKLVCTSILNYFAA